MDLFNQPVTTQEKYSHPLGGHSPKDLGLDMPEVNRLYIDGFCGGDEHHKNDSTVGEFNAHTHMCPLDPNNKSICIIERYLKNSDGTMSDILTHEYAHVLQEMPFKILGHGPVAHSHIIKRVGHLGKEEDAGLADWIVEEHGITFMTALRKLGRPDLFSPWANVPR